MILQEYMVQGKRYRFQHLFTLRRLQLALPLYWYFEMFCHSLLLWISLYGNTILYQAVLLPLYQSLSQYVE